MSKKKKSNSNNKSLIKENSTPKTIAIQKIIEDDYPLFCFRYLSDKSIKSCNKADFFIDFLIRLHKLSELGWEEIRKSGRHGFGMEPLHKSKIIPKLPECVTPDVTNVHVLRSSGSNLPLVGLQVGSGYMRNSGFPQLGYRIRSIRRARRFRSTLIAV